MTEGVTHYTSCYTAETPKNPMNYTKIHKFFGQFKAFYGKKNSFLTRFRKNICSGPFQPVQIQKFRQKILDFHEVFTI